MSKFLNITDLSIDEVKKVLEYSEKTLPKVLDNEIVPLVFQKPSLRTRLSIEKAIVELGGTPITLTSQEIGLDNREPLKDIVRTLNQYCGIFALRVYEHQLLEEIAEICDIYKLNLWVINMLSDLSHPLQSLADLLTIKQVSGKNFDDLKQIKLAYVGDANNVARSLIEITSMFRIPVSVATPENFSFDEKFLSLYKGNETFELTTDPKKAVKGADFIYTDTWISMGEENIKEQKLQSFTNFTVNNALLKYCEKDPYIMHCLPAHRGYEIDDEIIESSKSVVFLQARNRYLTAKGLLFFIKSRAYGIY